MEDNKLYLKYPVVVEGKYDKIKLSSVVASPIITIGGFSVFNNNELLALLKRLSAENGIILLTDSDRAGFFIRSKLRGMLGKNAKLFNLYIPQIKGKEKRKTVSGKDGLLGVEGIDVDKLRELLAEFETEKSGFSTLRQVTKGNFFDDGLSGDKDSSNRRDALAKALDLPLGMSANALIEAINLLVGYDKYKKALLEIYGEQK